MEYWRGTVDWEINPDWKCEVCLTRNGLEWGFVHAQCRCITCHTQYRMRDKEGKVVATPICQLKPEYYKAAQLGWTEYNKPIDEFTDEEWNRLLKEVENEI